MNEKLDDFLNEGLLRYGEVRSTSQFFEGEVRKVLRRVIERRTGSGAFVREDSQVPEGKPSVSGPPWWLWLAVAGKLASGPSATLQVGVTWDYEGAESSPVVYAGFQTGPEQLRRLTAVPSASDTKRFNYTRQEAYLCRGLARFSEIEGHLDALLDQLLQAAGG